MDLSDIEAALTALADKAGFTYVSFDAFTGDRKFFSVKAHKGYFAKSGTGKTLSEAFSKMMLDGFTDTKPLTAEDERVRRAGRIALGQEAQP